ncbi:uncharacterized protein LTR77_001968 [Saxophila tyrrhenica]|uniref:Uncharacterized protein n=1 Tax=Saxophila tyrrhenica TaxID=1690608 RepID=A0AAV9PH78_9PEZI|nr:hypothetical protein LTR77_001968 [Saxophila tyrrhenica]
MAFLKSQLLFKPPYPTTSFSSQTIIVTGSNTGLGREAARHFSRLDAAKLILAVRNTTAGEAAKKDILSTTRREESSIEVWPLDLSSFDSIRAFAERCKRELPRIDVLLENAGVAMTTYTMEKNGHEKTIMVNVIGTFYLALLLVPHLKEAAKRFAITPRLTIVSSEVHGFTKFPVRNEPNIFEALKENRKEYFKDRYQDSKLLEVLVVRQLAPKLEGSGVVLNMLNPGLCHSELSRDGPFVLEVIKFLLARSTEVGSRTLVASAAAGSESHGKYMSDAMVKEEALSPFVRSKESKESGEKVWRELRDILEAEQPGVTEVVR